MENWKTRFRVREINIIFQKVPQNIFNFGLELGAGAHIQTIPLGQYCKSLISTEYESRFNISEVEKKDNIKYLSCDAEKVDHTFNSKNFDLVFSSNMMEHLPNPDASFRGIYNILSDDGVSIHTMPNVFMKILYLIFYYPATYPIYLKQFMEKILIKSQKSISISGAKKDKITTVHDNNPKHTAFSRNLFSKLLIPDIHGACTSNIQELFLWRKKRWIKLIESHGFFVIKIIKLPVTTGYAFKLERFCEIMFKIGLCSSYAYVAVKNKNSNTIKYFS